MDSDFTPEENPWDGRSAIERLRELPLRPKTRIEGIQILLLDCLPRPIRERTAKWLLDRSLGL